MLVHIEFEGIDKAGKSMIMQYVAILSNYKYVLNDRGVLSQMVYNDKFKRGVGYKLYYRPIIVLLDVEEADLNIRTQITNEPAYSHKEDKHAFEAYAQYLESKGVKVFRFNTSAVTPIRIAQTLLAHLAALEKYFIDAVLLQSPIKLECLNLYKKEEIENDAE